MIAQQAICENTVGCANIHDLVIKKDSMDQLKRESISQTKHIYKCGLVYQPRRLDII